MAPDSIAVRIVRILQTGDASDRLRAGYLARQIHQHRAEMVAVTEKTRGARAAGEEKSEDVLVGLVDVARRTCENKIVATVVRRLSPAGCDMVQRDRPHADLALAIGADGAVTIEQPLPGIAVGIAAGR